MRDEVGEGHPRCSGPALNLNFLKHKLYKSFVD